MYPEKISRKHYHNVSDIWVGIYTYKLQSDSFVSYTINKPIMKTMYIIVTNITRYLMSFVINYLIQIKEYA